MRTASAEAKGSPKVALNRLRSTNTNMLAAPFCDCSQWLWLRLRPALRLGLRSRSRLRLPLPLSAFVFNFINYLCNLWSCLSAQLPICLPSWLWVALWVLVCVCVCVGGLGLTLRPEQTPTAAHSLIASSGTCLCRSRRNLQKLPLPAGPFG